MNALINYLTRGKKDIFFSSVKFFIFIYITFLLYLFSSISFANEKQENVGNHRYHARIQRTTHNIPHITAGDLPSAWFGQGYAMAEDRICTVLDQVIKVRSQRARFFGPGIDNANIESDFGYLHLGVVAKALRNWQVLPDNIRDMLTAHAAGINTYVANVGPEGLPELCRDAERIIEITGVDLLAYSMDFGLSNFSKLLLPGISDTFPPNLKIKYDTPATTEPTPIVPKASLEPKGDKTIGSNGWGLGADKTESRNGMLLANPHLPWEGELKLWESHITVPGEIDVYGVTLPGIPNTLIGFNRAVAWTLAVSSAAHETFYKLTLVPDEPTKYLYDGEVRSMKPSEYKIEVLNSDTGEVEQASRTLWSSHYGPVLSMPPFITWNKETVLTYRDANLDNSTYLSQFLDMSQAKHLKDFIEAHKNSVGIPFSHTIATTFGGNAWYADASPVPNISKETYTAWQQAVKSDNIVSSLWGIGYFALDGSTSRDEWVESIGASAPGLLPFAEKPQLLRRDFVFNSNDNHWLSNPDSPLEGYSPLYGDERAPLSLRTRANALSLSKGIGGEGKFSLSELQQVALSNNSLTGQLIKSELVNHCKKTPVVNIETDLIDITRACEVLAGWDETFDLDSKGAVLFREFLGTFNLLTDFKDAGDLFAQPFDPESPVTTPYGLTGDATAVDDPVLLRLAMAVKRLTIAGYDFNATLRDMQFTQKGEARIPIHGGNGREGLLNITDYSSGENSSLFTPMNRDKLVNPSTGLSESGYLVNSGTSFLMAVELTESGPQCQAMLTYSQSEDPASPFFADQTQLFSDKKWHQCLYDQKEIIADPKLRTYSVHELMGDIDKDGDVDRNDIVHILSAIKMSETENVDKYDLNKDDKISLLDVHQVIAKCTNPECRI